MFQCPACTRQYDKIISLSIHYRSQHHKTAKDLYVALNCNGLEPTCKCGCGEAVKFMDITRGFSEYKAGHGSRIKNNFQTKKSKANSLKTRRKMLETGEWKPFVSNETGKYWNEGLTAETDSRIAQITKKRDTREYLAITANRMRQNRLNGTIPTQKGASHSQWKGGISPLNNYCRASRKLHIEWKFPKLQAANFHCSACNKPGPGLEVHHDRETMSAIIRRFACEMGWESFFSSKPNTDIETLRLKEKISDAVADYHIQNNVSGVVLCEDCHRRLHDKLNF